MESLWFIYSVTCCSDNHMLLCACQKPQHAVYLPFQNCMFYSGCCLSNCFKKQQGGIHHKDRQLGQLNLFLDHSCYMKKYSKIAKTDYTYLIYFLISCAYGLNFSSYAAEFVVRRHRVKTSESFSYLGEVICSISSCAGTTLRNSNLAKKSTYSK